MVLVLLSLAVFPSLAIADHVPQQGDYFNYYEIENLGNGTGDYAGYSEHTVVNGTEIMNGVEYQRNRICPLRLFLGLEQ